MLHVRIDLVPFGRDENRETLQDIYIVNDGTGTRKFGNYDVYTRDPRGLPLPRSGRPGWVGRIERVRRSPWHRNALLARALVLVVDAQEVEAA